MMLMEKKGNVMEQKKESLDTFFSSDNWKIPD